MAVVINGNGTVTGVTAQDELNVDSNTLVVDSTNNRVGIGISNPSNALDIYAGIRPIRIQTSDSGECGMVIKNTDGEGELLIGTAEHIVLQNKTEGSDIWFGTKPTGGSNTERMRIDSSGRLLLNRTTGLANGRFCINGGGAEAASIQGGSNGYIVTWHNTSGTLIGSVTGSTGSSTSYNTTSDYRLKENVVDMTGAIDRLKLLQPRIFNFISDPDTEVDGFIAHEVSDVVPIAVSGEKDGMKDEEYEVCPALGEIYTPAIEEITDENGNVTQEAVAEAIISSDVEQPETLEDGQLWRETTPAEMETRTVPDYQGIDQSKLVPLLTGALQEAIAKIEALETRIEALENA